MLKLENLSKSFDGKKILTDINLTIDHGKIALLLGPSGGGKSTLLRILNNLETADSGSMILDGKPLDLKKIHTTHMVGIVFQQFNLFDHLTVIQNITLALEKVMGKSKQEAKSTAMQLLREYGLDDKANEYPFALSGGQKQRLALARALALKPKVICLDEPTSALDPVLTNQVAQTIQGLADQNYMVLVTTHDISLMQKLVCSIYLLKDGKILQKVESKDFFENESAYPEIKKFVSGQK